MTVEQKLAFPELKKNILKGGALLSVGYTIFGNKSYSYKMYS